MDRANSKHAARLDDEMAKETHQYLQGSGTGSRADEWREPEPGDESVETEEAVLSEDVSEGQSRLGRYLPRTAFPADRDRLVSAAVGMHAPDDVIATLEQLSDGPSYETVAEVWAALGHGLDRRA